MKNITTESNWVRVIGNTRNPNIKGMNEMIGEECEVCNSHYRNDSIYVWNKDKSDYYGFNKKDVRFLTAGMHKEKHIAIGDEVLVYGEWKKVVEFFMYDDEVKILMGTLKNTEYYNDSSIKDHRTEPSLSGTQVTVTIDGKDYPATVN